MKEKKDDILELFGHKIGRNDLYLIIIIVVMSIVLIVTTCVNYFMSQKKKAIQQEETNTQEVIYVPKVVTEEAEYTTDRKDIAALQQDHPDIYAWITVPGTEIDYPVLQSTTNNYYLTHTVEGAEELPGAIYTNQCNNKNFGDALTVVYGHNMKNGSYFAGLHDFGDTEFFANNREIYIYTTDRKITYKIFAASKFSNVYIPDKYGVALAASINNFVKDLKEYGADEDGNNFAGDIEIDSDEFTKVLVLSTCVSGQEENRYIVAAVKDREELYEE